MFDKCLATFCQFKCYEGVGAFGNLRGARVHGPETAEGVDERRLADADAARERPVVHLRSANKDFGRTLKKYIGYKSLDSRAR